MRIGTFLACVTAVSASPVFAALTTTDPSIINLYQLNEQTSGDLTNGIPGAFLDTAPTGTPQNHDDLSANAPTWVSGLPVGDGVGLQFNRSETDFTRFQGWMNTTQGNYSNGKSFTAMVRLNAANLVDNGIYNVLGIGSTNISLTGNSTPGTANVNVQLRDQNTFFTLNSGGATNGASSSGPDFAVQANTWVNLFLIYNANSSLSVALDDGTNFFAQTATGVPAGLDTIGEGFDNAGVPWFIGSLGDGTNTFDGRIESVVIWDKALTLNEADGINLDTAAVPEPAGCVALLTTASVLISRRRRR